MPFNISRVTIDLTAEEKSALAETVTNEVTNQMESDISEIRAAADTLAGIGEDIENLKNGKAALLQNIYTSEKNAAWNKDAWVFQINTLPTKNKMLCVIYTNKTKKDNGITIRGVYASPATYTGNVSGMSSLMSNGQQVFYGYFTPGTNDARMYFTPSSNTTESVTSKICIYDASDLDISNSDLVKLLEYGEIENFTRILKNVTYPLNVACEALGKIDGHIGESPDSIVCWGDSLTASGSGWVTMLKNSMIEDGYAHSVYNRGVGGDNSNNIMNRMGAVPVYVKPFTLPERNGSNVSQTIEFYSNAFGDVKYQYPSDTNSGIRECKLNGVEYGYISAGSGTTATFTRSIDGEEIIFDRPVYLTFDNQAFNDQITIIWCGTNDINQSAEYIIERQKAMVDYLKTDKYIIIGLTCDIRHDVKSYNAEMAKVWGRKFLDVQKYLVEFGLSDNALTATADDESKIAEGLIPRQLMISDQIHFNEYGYKAIANCVYQYLINEGYITK